MQNNILKYSQNFLSNPFSLALILKQSNITQDDIVYEIGPGTGFITKKLSKRCKKLIAIELDKNLYLKLKEKFKDEENIEIIYADFLSYTLPIYTYKIFSNIPFTISSQIIRKITNYNNSPTDSYLIVQKETALRYCQINKESLLSLMLKPFYNFNILYTFHESDFKPIPKVKIVLLHIHRKEIPDINMQHITQYKDFVAYCFITNKPKVSDTLKKLFTKNQINRLSKDLNFNKNLSCNKVSYTTWLSIFNYFLVGVTLDKQNIIKNYEMKLQKQQTKLKKIYRTRIDKNWKSK